MTSLQDLDWDKQGGLLPAIVQHADDGSVLMLGYMNKEALAATRAGGRVTFWSRSRRTLWTKGETSGHFLDVQSIAADCDGDALLVLARPTGPVCHLDTPTCWGADAPHAAVRPLAFLASLETIIDQRIDERPANSYTTQLIDQGTLRIAQKVGEEGLELALAAAARSDAEIIGEAADLLFHTLLLLRTKNITLAQVIAELESRHAARTAR
jgi:phosphoribosyl-ATP pyrophosphohydrolase/phosphoribosyl-AMP cyclohydrolase